MKTKSMSWAKFQQDKRGVCEGPIPASLLSEKPSPVFWSYQLGSGRVFATTTGHHTFTYFDPEFRIVLFLGIAWAMDIAPDPFMPLVFEGITDKEGMVGTQDKMRFWEGKKRPSE